MGLGAFPFKPYSLRRGGATYAFTQSHNYHTLMAMGRWANLRTVKIYPTSTCGPIPSTSFSLKVLIRPLASLGEHGLNLY